MTEKDFYQLLEEKLTLRLEENEHKALLKEILGWYKEGGSKQVKARLLDRVTLILRGLSEDVE
ncbi:MAG: hypothetical protein E3J73_05335 [Candidatus Bathyarchaeum sp.]|nr:MAG: hypothetical protein E3J73_05335 [Candidatus Bathyarchaeum sp.]